MVGQSEVDGGVVEGVEEDIVGPVGAYKIVMLKMFENETELTSFPSVNAL